MALLTLLALCRTAEGEQGKEGKAVSSRPSFASSFCPPEDNQEGHRRSSSLTEHRCFVDDPPRRGGQLHSHEAIESPRPQQSAIQNLRPIRRRDDHDALGLDSRLRLARLRLRRSPRGHRLVRSPERITEGAIFVIPIPRFFVLVVVGIEAVHLRQELVQRLLPLVVPVNPPRPRFGQRVDLIEEQNAGRAALRRFEQLPDARGASAHVELDEVRGGARDEVHASLRRRRPREQRLAAARGARQQDALGAASAHAAEALRRAQELDDLHELPPGRVRPRDAVPRELAPRSPLPPVRVTHHLVIILVGYRTQQLARDLPVSVERQGHQGQLQQAVPGHSRRPAVPELHVVLQQGVEEERGGHGLNKPRGEAKAGGGEHFQHAMVPKHHFGHLVQAAQVEHVAQVPLRQHSRRVAAIHLTHSRRWAPEAALGDGEARGRSGILRISMEEIISLPSLKCGK
eukprot:scaffold1282_cov251-Pinguiococcus_pyrenoidosus.AAC.6